MGNSILHNYAIDLLKSLISTPSFSGEEEQTANIIALWLTKNGIEIKRHKNNVWATNKHFDKNKPTVLLNSHHDTIKPNKAYTNKPFESKIENGKLYGLGSNDAGGCLVSLMNTFVHFYSQKDLKYNLVLAASAEEENSGPNGLNNLLEILPEITFAVVGEPTEMQMAVSEKGLLVIDAVASGIAGHAAHENTDNAIYNAMLDIDWIRHYTFPKISPTLGNVKMSVTQINAGEQHNVVPANCHFVIDVRVNEYYTNKEIFEIINAHTKSELKARSFHLNSSSISMDHPIVQAGISLGKKTYGSPTLSDQAVLSCPSLKLGPGVSARSHSADEYILIKEIEQGINDYINIFNQIL